MANPDQNTGGAQAPHAVARPGRLTRFTTATVLVYFQKYPGAFKDAIIDSVKGTVVDESGKRTEIEPVNGLYAVRVPKGGIVRLEVFDSCFFVRTADDEMREGDAESKEKNIPIPKHSIFSRAPENFNLISWGDLEPRENYSSEATPHAVKRRLDLLGYLREVVDGTTEVDLERSVLEFQADYGAKYNLLVDGQCGPKTSQALNEVLEKENASEPGKYFVRQTLVSFERWRPEQKHEKSPMKTLMRGDLLLPHVDARGYRPDATDASTGGPLRGPVVHVMPGQRFLVRLRRHSISARAPLIVRSTDEDTVAILGDSALPEGPVNDVALISKKAGTAAIEVRYTGPGAAGDGVVIAELNVLVAKDVIRLPIRPNLVSINGVKTQRREREIKKELIPALNAFYAPMGVQFELRPVYMVDTKTETLKGVPPAPGTVRRVDFYADAETVHRAPRKKGRFSRFRKEIKADLDAINVYFVRNMEGAFGLAQPPGTYPSGHCFVIVRDGTDVFTLAHEIGHYLRLANSMIQPVRWHSDNDPGPHDSKKDFWSRMSLMRSVPGWAVRPSDFWVRDYDMHSGTGLGGFVSVRNLEHVVTDGEVARLRAAASSPKVHG